MPEDKLKAQAAQAAIEYLQHKVDKDSVIGIGTGSTVNHFIKALPYLGEVTVVSSSKESTKLLNKLNIEVTDLNSVIAIDYYVDGADEIDPSLCMLKGGGGALTGEKILASISKEFLCIAHKDKYVKRLGEFPIAVEVLSMARSIVGRKIVELGGNPVYRQGFVSEHGNLIIDVYNADFVIDEVAENTLGAITGVVENGIFCRHRASKLFLAGDKGVDIFTGVKQI